MKFNMGCGLNRRDGYVNVDMFESSGADEVWNLENTPWPWPDSCAEEVLFIHSLEHMGEQSSVFLEIMRELYRICAPGAEVRIHVPHPRHDDFIDDPTHVRAITPRMLSLFDREANERVRAAGGANTPLAIYLNVDFQVAEVQTVPAEPYMSRLKAGEITTAELSEAVRSRNNVASEFRIRLVARK